MQCLYHRPIALNIGSNGLHVYILLCAGDPGWNLEEPNNVLYLLSNPAFCSMLTGYHIIGLFPIGNNGLGILAVRSIMCEPRPAAIITA